MFAQIVGICRKNHDCEERVALDMLISHVGADIIPLSCMMGRAYIAVQHGIGAALVARMG
jgi:hypothetical protein